MILWPGWNITRLTKSNFGEHFKLNLRKKGQNSNYFRDRGNMNPTPHPWKAFTSYNQGGWMVISLTVHINWSSCNYTVFNTVHSADISTTTLSFLVSWQIKYRGNICIAVILIISKAEESITWSLHLPCGPWSQSFLILIYFKWIWRQFWRLIFHAFLVISNQLWSFAPRQVTD